MEKVLSICIPVFNGGEVAYQHIKEILRHESNEIEVIVSDNASEDNTLELLKSINDKRLKILTHKKNVGPYLNWYHALMAGTAKYVMLLNDNDRIVIKNLTKYLEFLKNVHYDTIRNAPESKVSGEITVAQAQDYNARYSHTSYVVYRREALHSIKPLKCSFDFSYTSYAYDIWDTQILMKYSLNAKKAYINGDIKITHSPRTYSEKKSRTKLFGDSSYPSLALPYTYESIISYFVKYMKVLRHLYSKDREYSKLICNAYRVNIWKAIVHYYMVMKFPQLRWQKKRYGLDMLNESQINYIRLNKEFFRTTASKLNIVSPFWRMLTIIKLKIITECNESDFILNYYSKRNKIKHREARWLLNKLLNTLVDRICK